MLQKRLRIFAGPNGSGKSSIIKALPSSVELGFYINADDIERQIVKGEKINLKKYGVKTNTANLHDYFDQSAFVKEKSNIDNLKSLFFY